jgi:ribose transport system ATP-binding protein
MNPSTSAVLSSSAASVAPESGLVCTGLTKTYGGVAVVNEVDISLTPGSVVGLVGENGAGKSTTSAMIAGMVQPDSGTMTIDGESYEPRSPGDALRAGVALIHQEIRMIPDLSVAENIFLGRLPTRRGRVDAARMEEESAHVLGLLGSHINPRRPVRGLSIASQQEIEIARALTRSPRFVIFDEPSASLGESETARVFDQIDVLRSNGVGIVYISHKLDEIARVADRIVVLRDGRRVADWPTGSVVKNEIVRAMVGRDFTYGHSEPSERGADVALEVRDLARTGVFEGVSFSVNRGEILGVAGLIGAGRTEMVRTIAGSDRATSGEILVAGKAIEIKNPASSIRAGIAMVPEDRKGQGLNLDRPGADNMTLPWEGMLAQRGLVTRGVLEKVAREQREFLDIRGRTDIPVRHLSGGNQQKVLLGKWLIKRPDVLILDEPTRGVDVGAKMTIYDTIRRLASEGVAIIVVSSELEEVLGLSHRVLVMAAGRQQGILTRTEATPEAVMRLALRGHTNTDIDTDN